MQDDLTTLLADFDGTARLFPLPNLVMYPNALQPLHIFEARYRAMTAEALASDRLLALVLLKEGWDKDYDNRPAIHQTACLGRIVGDYKLPDGRYNLLFKGLARVRIHSELPPLEAYRKAKVEIVADRSTTDVQSLIAKRRKLEETLMPRLGDGPLGKQLSELFHSDMPLGPVCNVLAFALPLPLALKQELLETVDVEQRAKRLLQGARELLGVHAPDESPDSCFPPPFSVN